MKIPFFKAAGATTDLVKDYNFKQHYTAINQNTAWADISPQIRQAVEEYILPYLGDTLYDDITTMLENDDVLTTSQEKFARLLKDTTAYYSAMHIMQERKVILSSMGPVENIATENTTGSSLWGFKTTLWTISQKADKLMDRMLAYMEERVEAGDAYFVTNWAETPAYNTLTTSFFRYVKDFQPYHGIHNSFRVLKRLVPIIEECAEIKIKPILCSDQYAALLTAIKENTETAAQTALIEKVRRALAKWVIYEATQQIPFLPDQEGFRIVTNSDSIDQRAYLAQNMSEAIQGIRESAERSARQFTADLVDFLYENKADYPLWENSTCNKLNNTDPEKSVYQNGPGAVWM